MTKALLGILLLVSLVGGGWYLLRAPETTHAPTYSQAQVLRDDISDAVSATGTLSPINTVQVGSQVSWTIQQLFADLNDQVKQGQPIAQIDPAIFQAKLAEVEILGNRNKT